MVPAAVPKRVAQALGCQCHPSRLSWAAASGLAHFWFGMRSSSAGCPGNARCSPPDGDGIWQSLLKILPNSAATPPAVSHPRSPLGLRLGQCCPCWYPELALGRSPWVGGDGPRSSPCPTSLPGSGRPGRTTSAGPSSARPAPAAGDRTGSQGQLVAFTHTKGRGELPGEGPTGTGGLLGKVMIP